MRNRCVKLAFNNGSFGTYFPAYCEPMTINKINHARLSFILLFTFCQCLVIAGLLLAVVFSFAVFVLLRKVRYMLTICAMHSPVVLVVCLPIQWRNVAIWGNGWLYSGLNEVLTIISIFWGFFRLNPLIILALKC